MKITVLHGQTHKGSTQNITRLFLNKLSDENTEITEFFMTKDAPPFCLGCFNCFMKGEAKCPHSSIVQPIAKAMEEADLLVLESPCYVFGMSGQMKTFLDHVAYRWISHRPHGAMYNKVGLCISTSAGAGEKKVTKALKEQLFWLGVPKIYRYSKKVAASSWEQVKPEKKAQIEEEVTRLAKRIKKNICRVKPGIKTKFMFNIMRMNQKANDWNAADKEHWMKNGWLTGAKPW
jgi:multimeric flavodoxin WrbA